MWNLYLLIAAYLTWAGVHGKHLDKEVMTSPVYWEPKHAFQQVWWWTKCGAALTCALEELNEISVKYLCLFSSLPCLQ